MAVSLCAEQRADMVWAIRFSKRVEVRERFLLGVNPTISNEISHKKLMLGRYRDPEDMKGRSSTWAGHD